MPPSLPRRVLLALLAACAAGSALSAQEFTDLDRSHWSLSPRSQPAVPALESDEERAWARTPVDAFVLRRLREAGLQPAPQADRRTLARRVYFQLTGLPPAPAEMAEFLADSRPGAYQRLVDRLLARPSFGERWAQKWLDVVRFAESEGFEYDRHLPGAWRFRDYVIAAANSDKPYDQFVLQQLAGDEIAPHSHEALVAAGFHRLGPVRRNAGNTEVAFSRNEVLTERTNIIGSAFLGMTVGCARCHDHKFDPIRQVDYYRMQAFLAASFEHNHSLAPDEQQQQWQRRHDQVQAELAELKKQLETAGADEREALQEQMKAVESRLPEPLATIATVRNQQATPIHRLTRGDVERPAELVSAAVLGVLLPDGPPPPADSSRLRTQLARWIVAKDNPLTARVIVNRVWQFHFGRGLVATPNDFGMNGGEPSHPELLDYLADRLIEDGWQLKTLHRLLVTSAVFRQASQSPHRLRGQQVDPHNEWLWHFKRRRLEAPQIRDAMLAASGSLNRQAGGPSVMLPVDPQLVDLLYKPAQWQSAPSQAQRRRRSIYLIAKRNLQLPFMAVFDQPDLQTSCAVRVSSTHAPQALELLNGRIANELAYEFADSLRREAGDDPAALAELGFQQALGRPPTERERALTIDFLDCQPLREFALALLNLNDFLYLQ